MSHTSGNLRNIRRTYALGSVPPGAEWTCRQIQMMRRELESAVVSAKGQIDTYDSACINTACRWERHSLLVLRWLRKNAETMSDEMRLAYSRDVARASESRDKAIRSLGISSDEVKRNSIEALYHEPVEADDPEDVQPDPNASDGESEASEGGE